MIKIGVVIVTYNRLGFLKKVIGSYENMTRKPDVLVIVNNGSNDGTREFLEVWKNSREDSMKKVVLNLSENIGGSGGFYLGLKEILSQNVDWVWVSDDDALPGENALMILEKYIKFFSDKNEPIAALCGSVYKSMNEIDLVHRRRIVKKFLAVKEISADLQEYSRPFFEIDEFSYVGVAMNVYCLREKGLPRSDFFIYYDDTEHSLRLKQCGKIICVPDIKVYHGKNFFDEISTFNVNIKKNDATVWRTYYGIRNKLITYKMHFGFFPFLNEFLRTTFKQSVGIILKKNVPKRKAALAGAIDALKGKTGKHHFYYPH